MPTYSGNCYEIVSDVRRGLNEYSTAFVQGTDTTGAYSNELIIKKINDAQRYLWNILFTRFPDVFLKSSSLTGVNSVYTLPADCFKIRRFENDNKIKIRPMNLDEKHVGDTAGNEYLYYRKGNTLVMDKDAMTNTFTLWYYSRCRDLTHGLSTAGAALSLTLATTARKEADYYNDMIIENITDDWTDTISDYSASRVCTLAAQTGAVNKYYGIVSELPEAFHHLIGPRAIILMRDIITSPEKPTVTGLRAFQEMLSEALKSYAGTQHTDVTQSNIWEDFEVYV